MTKHIFIAVAVLLLGGVIAEMHVATQSYQPIVRVESPDGVTYTAVLDTRRERPACGVASQRFVEPIRATCPECRIVFARCRREGEGLPALAGELGAEEPYSLVRMPGVSIAIEGSPDNVRRTCEMIASGAQKLGVQSARCAATAPQVPRT